MFDCEQPRRFVVLVGSPAHDKLFAAHVVFFPAHDKLFAVVVVFLPVHDKLFAVHVVFLPAHPISHAYKWQTPPPPPR